MRMISKILIAGATIACAIGSAQGGTSATERTWYYGSAFIGGCEIIGAPDVIYRVLTSPEIGLKRCDGMQCGMTSATDADGDISVRLILEAPVEGFLGSWSPIGMNFFTSKEKCERRVAGHL